MRYQTMMRRLRRNLRVKEVTILKEKKEKKTKRKKKDEEEDDDDGGLKVPKICSS